MILLEKVATELRECGFAPRVVTTSEFGVNNVVIIPSYHVTTGRFKNQYFDIAIGFQESGYPQYPPHFIYVAGLTDPKFPVHGSPFRYNNANWCAFSVPPNDFWDSLQSSMKNMKTYVNRHLTRFWSQV